MASDTNLITNLQGQAGKLDTRLKAIEAAAPQIIDALTKLKDGLTQAAAGLNSLKTLATSQEYENVRALFGEQPGELRLLARLQYQDAIAVQSVSHLD